MDLISGLQAELAQRLLRATERVIGGPLWGKGTPAKFQKIRVEQSWERGEFRSGKFQLPGGVGIVHKGLAEVAKSPSSTLMFLAPTLSQNLWGPVKTSGRKGENEATVLMASCPTPVLRSRPLPFTPPAQGSQTQSPIQPCLGKT